MLWHICSSLSARTRAASAAHLFSRHCTSFRDTAGCRWRRRAGGRWATGEGRRINDGGEKTHHQLFCSYHAGASCHAAEQRHKEYLRIAPAKRIWPQACRAGEWLGGIRRRDMNARCTWAWRGSNVVKRLVGLLRSSERRSLMAAPAFLAYAQRCCVASWF